VRAYLDVSNETRRLMWTLAHAHGALIAIVNILYGLTLERDARADRAFASRALMAAGVVLPLGFFLGGLVYYGGDRLGSCRPCAILSLRSSIARGVTRATPGSGRPNAGAAADRRRSPVRPIRAAGCGGGCAASSGAASPTSRPPSRLSSTAPEKAPRSAPLVASQGRIAQARLTPDAWSQMKWSHVREARQV
jgi:hypothetical protein